MAGEPRTLCDIFLSAAACGKPSLLVSKVGGAWKSISAADFGFTVKALSLGLNGLGVQPGDRVAILSENRPEWAMADFAILCAGAWSVPIYPTLPAGQVAPLLNDCGAKAVFVSTLEQLGKILTIKAQCPTLDHVILIEGHPPRSRLHDLPRRRGSRPADAEMSPGVFEQRAARVKPEDVATIIYASGTTGEPKGAMLTHRNFVSNVVTGCEVIPFAADALALSFLPLSHVFERMVDYAYMHKTAAIAYAESIDKLAANFLELDPIASAPCPRLREGPREDHGEGGRGQRDPQEALHLGDRVGRARVAYMERGEPCHAASRARRRSPTRWSSRSPGRARDRLRLRRFGGAPLSRDLAEFFMGRRPVYEGYGLTRRRRSSASTGPGAATGDRRAGVGIEVKIAEDGEILTRGPPS